ncbi:MAG: N-acetyl-gamma-glutamyl-phosphate reductase [Lachnospiraceae bacterium]|nr:N-acetyl-gamma-glutamyl-phosphate reductase [Lachnospiraceae bacterium]
MARRTTVTKVFIDGSEGTTGLRINERFEGRDDIEILKISSELRKDPDEIKKFINASDVTFLCLPDAAAKEAVAMVENENTVIIDTSTAHRTESNFAYGYPELSKEHREAIRNGKRIAVPGCHATGFITLVYPMIAGGIMPKNYPVSSFSLTGYSGGGKKMIAEYEGEDRKKELDSPREYALSQQHKHLKEMQAITGLERKPLFSPIVADYYSGMLVSVPLYTDMLSKKKSPEEIRDFFAEYYKGEKFVKVMPFGAEADTGNFLGSNNVSGWDGIEVYVTGNEDRILLSSRFDNLGKGASGAAVQCLNIVLGCDEAKGLNL